MRPPEHIHDCAGVHSSNKEEGGGGVPGVLQPGVAHTRQVQQRFPLLPVPSRINGLPNGTGEHPSCAAVETAFRWGGLRAPAASRSPA